jgi:hypothetical protein
VAETTIKRLICCGFRLTDKAMGQLYESWGRVCQEINVVSSLEYHMFYVLYPFLAYLLTLPRRGLVTPSAICPVLIRDQNKAT